MILTIWVPVLIIPAHFVLTKKFWQEKAWKHLIYFYTKLRTIVYHQKYYVNFLMLLLALYCLTAVKYGVLTNVKILKKSIWNCYYELKNQHRVWQYMVKQRDIPFT